MLAVRRAAPPFGSAVVHRHASNDALLRGTPLQRQAPPDMEAMLHAVPFHARPAECLQSLAELAERRPRWVIWKGVSDRLVPFVRAGVYEARDLILLFGILARARVLIDRARVPDPCWEPPAAAASELLEEAALALTASFRHSPLVATDVKLGADDYGSLCESFLRLELHPSIDFGSALAEASGLVDDTRMARPSQLQFSNMAFAWIFAMYQQLAPLQLADHAAVLRSRLHWRAPQTWSLRELRVVVRNAMPYVPIRSNSDAVLHWTVLSAALQDLAKERPGSGLTPSLARYMVYLWLCSGSRWTHLLDAIRHRDLAALFTRGTSNFFVDGFDRQSKVSGLEKDVQRVLDSLVRRTKQARRDCDKHQVLLTPQVLVFPAMFVLDYVLAPDVIALLGEKAEVRTE